MAYEKQNFTSGQVLTADHLNNIEEGICQNEKALEEKQPKGEYLTEHQKLKTINGEYVTGEGDISIDIPEHTWASLPDKPFNSEISDVRKEIQLNPTGESSASGVDLEIANAVYNNPQDVIVSAYDESYTLSDTYTEKSYSRRWLCIDKNGDSSSSRYIYVNLENGELTGGIGSSGFIGGPPVNISVTMTAEVIRHLDSKFIGEDIARLTDIPKTVGIYGTGENSEIFNNYETNVASGNYSHAEGSNTKASGFGSHAEGGYTVASGVCSHAECDYAVASGNYSHAEGLQTEASGAHSHAEGYNTTATRTSAHAEGNGSDAIADESHAEGLGTIASGGRSHAEGMNTVAAGHCQHVQGKWNIEDADGKYAHIVGNGTNFSELSNAHTLDWGGNAWYQGSLRLGGTSYDDASEVALKSDIPEHTWSSLPDKPFDVNVVETNIINLDFALSDGDGFAGDHIEPNGQTLKAIITGNFGEVELYTINEADGKRFVDESKNINFIITEQQKIPGFYNIRYNAGTETVTSIAVFVVESNITTLDPRALPTTVPSIPTANVGDTIKVKAVDENGVPTEWEAVAAESGGVQANLTQNDPEAPDYVKGRTHWVEVGEVTLVDNVTVTIPSNLYVKNQFTFALLNNIDYTVVWDGAEYNCTSRELDGAYVIGNSSINDMGYDTGEPFFIVSIIGGNANYVYGSSQGDHTITLVCHDEVIHKIPEKFLPTIIGTAGAGQYAEVFNCPDDNVATEYASHAEGWGTKATGKYSHAEGYSTQANGESSHAEGTCSASNGHGSHAEGMGTADGMYSHAEGFGTYALGDYQHVQGHYNIPDEEGKYLHIVGNSRELDSSYRNIPSNAHTLDWSGNAWYQGTVEGTAMIVKSSTEGSTKRFKITVDDSGTISATEITE